jgi:hypothetical protein
MRILNYQMSAINYVLLSKDICKGVKRVIIDKGGLFDIHSDHVIIQIVFNTSPIQKENKRVVNAPQVVIENKRGNRLAYVSGMHKKQA